MRLLLIRHGQTAANVAAQLDTAYPGTPLNEKGHEQAQALAERLSDEQIDAVYASDLTRAQETAAPFAAERGLDVQVVPDLKEIQAGDWEMTEDWSGLIEVFGQWRDGNLDAGCPGGDTGTGFLARYDAAIRQIATTDAQCVAAVSHGAAMRVWVSNVCPNATDEFIRTARLSNTTVIELDGSPDDGWTLVSWTGESVPEPPED